MAKRRGVSLYSRNSLANLRITAEWNACKEFYGPAITNLAAWHARRSTLNMPGNYWCGFVLRHHPRMRPARFWRGIYG